jgi:hypothetical protein
MARIFRRTGSQQAADERVAWTRFPLAAVAAIVAAAAGAAVLYGLESALGLIDHSVALPSPAGTGPVSFASVASTAALASFWAAVAFAVIGLVGRRPITVFRTVATVVVVLSLAMPATIPGPPVGMRFGLGLMHVLTWATNVAVLTTLARRS